jgi:hypothetical protein
MPRTCTICNHEKLAEINNAVLGNESYRSIAKRFEASESAVYRHMQDHLPITLSKAKEAAQEVEAGTLFERLRTLNQETQAILRDARDSGNHVVALAAIGRAEKQLELEARLLGELDDRIKIAVGVSVESPTVDQSALLADAFSRDELEEIRNRLQVAQAKRVNPTDHGDRRATTVYAALPNGETDAIEE